MPIMTRMHSIVEANIIFCLYVIVRAKINNEDFFQERKLIIGKLQLVLYQGRS